MNLTDFLLKVQDDSALALPKEFHIDVAKGDITENWKWHTRQDFKKWQNHRSVNLSFAVPYGINHNVLTWPSIREVETSEKSKFRGTDFTPSLETYIGHRTQ